MAVITSDIAEPYIWRAPTVGPVTSARHRRTAAIYGAMCILGLMPRFSACRRRSRRLGSDCGFPAADSSRWAATRSCCFR